MLVIREAQLRAFEQVQKERFVETTVDRIAREHPEAYAERGREGTRALVHDGIERAARYGVEETGAVGAFIDLMLRFRPDFETMPELEGVLEVLGDEGLSGEAKMTIVVAQIADAWGNEQAGQGDG